MSCRWLVASYRDEGAVGDVLIELVPFIIGAAVVPVHAIIVMLLLRGAAGVLKALAFVSGMILVRLAQGVVFGPIFSDIGGDEDEVLVTSMLLLVIGLLMWIAAIRKLRKEDDPDDPPPRWLTMMSDVTPFKAFKFGALLLVIAAKQWVFTLGAIGTIGEGELKRSTSIVAFLIYVFAGSTLILTPILLRAVAPQRSAELLEGGGAWLERNNRVIVIAVSVIFGTFFLFRGITGLTG